MKVKSNLATTRKRFPIGGSRVVGVGAAFVVVRAACWARSAIAEAAVWALSAAMRSCVLRAKRLERSSPLAEADASV